MKMLKIVLALGLFLYTNLSTGITGCAESNFSQDNLNDSQLPKRIFFSGYEWEVKAGRHHPGKNDWLADNVWVDSEGLLHLKITRRDTQWYCAELRTVKSFGYGTYQFQVIGTVDKLDPNIVLGLFVYPAPENPDEGNEIDIEYAKWGKPEAPSGNYTVASSSTTYHFHSLLEGNYTTHQFVWTDQQVNFQSFHGHVVTEDMEIANWLYNAKTYQGKTAVPPVRVHMNLWLFRGKAPLDSQEQEIIINKFIFTAKP